MSPKGKEEIIEERKSNLPLPEQPPRASDWNSSDSRSVNVGSGRLESSTSYGAQTIANDPLRSPPGDGELPGRQAKDHLPGIPNDAVTVEKRKAPGTVETRNPTSTA